jgi:hypothetical protein
MRRETSHALFLMCPFCVRALISLEATHLRRGSRRRRRPFARRATRPEKHCELAGVTWVRTFTGRRRELAATLDE